MTFSSSKLTGSRLKGFYTTTALVAVGVMMFSMQARAVDEHADWDSVQITKGNASVTDTGLGKTFIEQKSMRAVGEAGSLHIGTKGEVTINQASKDALFVGRATADNADPTQILGTLRADGRVMVIDRNGVIFGENARVDAAGIIATTGSVDDAQIMSGSERLEIKDFGKGKIENKGTINVSDAGLAAFVAPVVKNSGTINAKMGHVVMAAGEKVTLDLYGDGLVEVAVEGELSDTLIENKGTIIAEGGSVQLTARAAKQVVDSVINNEGVIAASSATVKGGKIILSAGNNGNVDVSGTLDASGNPEGGEIKVTGRNVNIKQSAKIKNSGKNAKTTLKADEKMTFKGKVTGGENSKNEISGHDLELGGTTELGAGSTIDFDPAILNIGAAEALTFVNAMNNNGVTVNISAQDRINVNAAIDTSWQDTNSVLFFKDENANNNLQVDLNNTIKVGDFQTLSGDATRVNVADSGLIQNGVDIAVEGGTVNVAYGTYTEAVKVDKSLFLLGSNAGVSGTGRRLLESRIITTAPSGIKTGITVTADNVTVDGFQISGGHGGIKVDGAENVTLKNNYIHGQYHLSGDGNGAGGLGRGDSIYAQDVTNLKIQNNLLENYNDDGIQINRVNTVEVSGNTVRDSGSNGDEGIGISFGTGNITVKNNNISSARRDGIQLIDVTGTGSHAITGNTVFGSRNAGVSLVRVNGSTVVDDNTITGGNYGVDAVNVRNLLIGDSEDCIAGNRSGNKINTATMAAVKVSGSDNVVVQDNILSSTFGDGVAMNDSNNVLVKENQIIVARYGVRLWNGFEDKEARLINNFITSSSDGVRVDGGMKNSSLIMTDSVISSGGDGFKVNGAVDASHVLIQFNDITGARNGINISGNDLSGDSLIEVNINKHIQGRGGDGIRVGDTIFGGSSVKVFGNTYMENLGDGITASQNGINITNVENVNVYDNYVHNVGATGINIENAFQADLIFNHVEYSGINGMSVQDVDNANITHSLVFNSNQSGLYINTVANILMADNTFVNNSRYGLHVDGANNGYLNLQGNNFSGSVVGARFESGEIDVSDALNPNAFILNVENVSSTPFIGMQFDGNPMLLTITDNTLGATIFNGYGSRSVGSAYYVRIENNAILDVETGFPIHIDGTFANWDGFVPQTFGNVLTPSQLQIIEDRLFDADDFVLNRRGQIFVGSTEEPVIEPPVDEETPILRTFLIPTSSEILDFIPQIEVLKTQSDRTSVRVLGLPPIDLDVTAANVDLNSIEPAAGNEAADFAVIEPAAGAQQVLTAEEANAIEPSAGEEVTCWGDAVNALGSGAVTYSFGGTFEDTIAGQTSCASSAS